MVGLEKIDWRKSIEERNTFVLQLQNRYQQHGILLETCNRVEWYYGSGKISDSIARHLFRVVSGMESSLIGESAIVGQVKQAYQDATIRHQLDKSLHKLFQNALFVGKRVRKETGISTGAMSHSQAAVQLLFREVGEVKDLHITVLGVNALNEKIIKFLVNKGSETIFIGNRTYEKASALANKFGAKAFRFDQLNNILSKTNVIISATSASHFILTKEHFSTGNQIYILDLAVPRDVAPEVQELPNIKLYDIETIENQIKNNFSIRKEKLIHAEEIVEKEVQIFGAKF